MARKRGTMAGVVSDYLRTMKDTSGTRILWGECLLYLVGPFVFGGLAVVTKFKMSESLVSALLNTVAILSGLLFNLLVLVQTVSRIRRVVPEREATGAINEARAGIAFAIFMSLLSLIPLVILASGWLVSDLPKTLISAVATTLVSSLGLTLFSVLLSVNVLLRHELQIPPEKSKTEG